MPRNGRRGAAFQLTSAGMPFKWVCVFCLGIVVSATLGSLSAVQAAACNPGDVCATQTIEDFYFGGLNTRNGQDVIGASNVFNITSAIVTLDATTNALTVQVNTNFAGAPASSNSKVAGALLGQTYGALFLGPGGTGSTWLANHPTPPSSSNTYPTDLYHPGEWTIAVNMSGSGNSGGAGVYAVGANQTKLVSSSYNGVKNSNTGQIPWAYNTTDSQNNNLGRVVMSNEYGNPITYPNPGNGANGQRYYFRQGQAVQFSPDAPTISGTGSSSYVITPTTWSSNGTVITEGSITYTISDFSALDLTNDIAISWAMSCANDIIQGVVDFNIPVVTPLPGALPLFAGGLALLGFAGRRRKNQGAI
jgi:hypothetical protein